MFDLPASARVDRIIPKTKFYERTHISTTIRDEFTGIIGRITWAYKLAPTTLNIPATETVQEIQIFQIELKQKNIPRKALAVIDKTIPYPILFVLTYQSDICYVIQHKFDSKRRYYMTEWNKLPQLTFNGASLENIYHRMVLSPILINVADDEAQYVSFEETITANDKREQLQKEISALENKIRSEKQFSKKVVLNTVLRQKKDSLGQLE